MRGKKSIPKRIKPDVLYNSTLVTKFINYVMQDGKKATSRKIVYKALEELSKKTNKPPLDAFEIAIENVKPRIEVRSRRVGGANLQVPTPVSPSRQVALAMRWLIDFSRANRKNTEFYESLAKELIASFNKEGSAYKKKEDVHRMAEANKVFTQFAITANV
jgi:small subunit ribosomal protein S7